MGFGLAERGLAPPGAVVKRLTQLFAEQSFTGSSPVRASTFLEKKLVFLFSLLFFGKIDCSRVASSSVERFSDKEEVDGPTPSLPTIIWKI